MRLENKVIIVTGSTTGIGKAIALAFAAAKYNLFLCSRNEKEIMQFANEIQRNFNG